MFIHNIIIVYFNILRPEFLLYTFMFLIFNRHTLWNLFSLSYYIIRTQKHVCQCISIYS